MHHSFKKYTKLEDKMVFNYFNSINFLNLILQHQKTDLQQKHNFHHHLLQHLMNQEMNIKQPFVISLVLYNFNFICFINLLFKHLNLQKQIFHNFHQKKELIINLSIHCNMLGITIVKEYFEFNYLNLIDLSHKFHLML